MAFDARQKVYPIPGEHAVRTRTTQGLEVLVPGDSGFQVAYET